jgi:hypothetical protein
MSGQLHAPGNQILREENRLRMLEITALKIIFLRIIVK